MVQRDESGTILRVVRRSIAFRSGLHENHCVFPFLLSAVGRSIRGCITAMKVLRQATGNVTSLSTLTTLIVVVLAASMLVRNLSVLLFKRPHNASMLHGALDTESHGAPILAFLSVPSTFFDRFGRPNRSNRSNFSIAKSQRISSEATENSIGFTFAFPSAFLRSSCSAAWRGAHPSRPRPSRYSDRGHVHRDVSCV